MTTNADLISAPSRSQVASFGCLQHLAGTLHVLSSEDTKGRGDGRAEFPLGFLEQDWWLVGYGFSTGFGAIVAVQESGDRSVAARSFG